MGTFLLIVGGGFFLMMLLINAGDGDWTNFFLWIVILAVVAAFIF